jgi:glycosyltransferase involved in cell wall biosynthesis
MDAPEWAHERELGTVLALDTRDERKQAVAMLDHLESTDYDLIFVNVLADRVQSSVVRHLESRLRRIMIVHSITPGTYAAARSIRDYVHATVGVSPRIRSDLIQRAGFSAEHTHTIPNCFDGEIQDSDRRWNTDGPLRLLSLGRLEDASKGIFWLPAILRELSDLPVTLTIAGDGPDRTKLQRLFHDQTSRVVFAGPIALTDVAGIMAQHDVFLLPSRYEGQSIALVEALATGCVPIASRIRDVTDFVVEEGKTGLLFPVGDTKTAGKLVRRLHEDRRCLGLMSAAGRESAARRFRTEEMATAYAGVIDRIMAQPRQISTPLPRERWSLPRGLRPGLRSLLPEAMKNRVRLILERFAA